MPQNYLCEYLLVYVYDEKYYWFLWLLFYTKRIPGKPRQWNTMSPHCWKGNNHGGKQFLVTIFRGKCFIFAMVLGQI